MEANGRISALIFTSRKLLKQNTGDFSLSWSHSVCIQTVDSLNCHISFSFSKGPQKNISMFYLLMIDYVQEGNFLELSSL